MDGTIHLTTEELGLLSTGKKLTFSVGEEALTFSAEDLDISVSDLASGLDAQIGGVVISYS